MLPPSVRSFVAASPIQREPIARAVAQEAAVLDVGSRVLDAGAGEAPYRPLFDHCDYVTQDWPGTVHAGARQADVIGDLHDLDLADDTFDAVLLTEVLEHVAEPGRVLAELRRILRPGGRILLTVPFVGELHEEPHDHYRYTSHGLRGLLDRGGFDRVEVSPLTGWFSTLAHVLRHQGASTAEPGRPVPLIMRIVGFGLLGISNLLRVVAPALDRRLDPRKALPIGWVARAHVPAAGGTAETTT